MNLFNVQLFYKTISLDYDFYPPQLLGKKLEFPYIKKYKYRTLFTCNNLEDPCQ